MNEINVHTIVDELRIHTIADLQLHIFHHGKVFLALTLALALAMTLALALALALASDSGFCPLTSTQLLLFDKVHVQKKK